MPSLRRSASSPAVRVTPYPSSLSAASGAHPLGGNRPRRSGSDTVSRRVLADIEWWRVLVGQHQEEPEAAQEQDPSFGQEEAEAAVVSYDRHRIQHDDAGIIRPSTPVSQGVIPQSSLEPSSLMSPFAALSLSTLGPVTPPRRRHSREASDSSTESTPEQPRRLDMYFDSVGDLGLGQNSVPRPTVSHSTRSLSFGALSTSSSTADDRFGDVVFL